MADLAIAQVPASIFVAAMLCGMVLHRLTFVLKECAKQDQTSGDMELSLIHI